MKTSTICFLRSFRLLASILAIMLLNFLALESKLFAQPRGPSNPQPQALLSPAEALKTIRPGTPDTDFIMRRLIPDLKSKWKQQSASKQQPTAEAIAALAQVRKDRGAINAGEFATKIANPFQSQAEFDNLLSDIHDEAVKKFPKVSKAWEARGTYRWESIANATVEIKQEKAIELKTQARADLLHAAELTPDRPDVHELIAEISKSLNDEATAKKHLFLMVEILTSAMDGKPSTESIQKYHRITSALFQYHEWESLIAISEPISDLLQNSFLWRTASNERKEMRGEVRRHRALALAALGQLDSEEIAKAVQDQIVKIAEPLRFRLEHNELSAIEIVELARRVASLRREKRSNDQQHVDFLEWAVSLLDTVVERDAQLAEARVERARLMLELRQLVHTLPKSAQNRQLLVTYAALRMVEDVQEARRLGYESPDFQALIESATREHQAVAVTEDPLYRLRLLEQAGAGWVEIVKRHRTTADSLREQGKILEMLALWEGLAQEHPIQHAYQQWKSELSFNLGRMLPHEFFDILDRIEQKAAPLYPDIVQEMKQARVSSYAFFGDREQGQATLRDIEDWRFQSNERNQRESLGRTAMKLGDYETALKLLAPPTADPANQPALNRTAAQRDERLYFLLVQTELLRQAMLPDDSVHSLRRKSIALAILGNDDEAESALTRAIELQPTTVVGRCWRAARRTALGRYEEAEADLAEALTMSPKSWQALATRGALRQAQLRFDEALADYASALEVHPDCHEARMRRAQILYYLGNQAEADAERELGRQFRGALIPLLLPRRLYGSAPQENAATKPHPSLFPQGVVPAVITPALIEIARGNTEGAVELMRRLDDPTWHQMRRKADPGYQELIQKANELTFRGTSLFFEAPRQSMMTHRPDEWWFAAESLYKLTQPGVNLSDALFRVTKDDLQRHEEGFFWRELGNIPMYQAALKSDHYGVIAGIDAELRDRKKSNPREKKARLQQWRLEHSRAINDWRGVMMELTSLSQLDRFESHHRSRSSKQPYETWYLPSRRSGNSDRANRSELLQELTALRLAEGTSEIELDLAYVAAVGRPVEAQAFDFPPVEQWNARRLERLKATAQYHVNSGNLEDALVDIGEAIKLAPNDNQWSRWRRELQKSIAEPFYTQAIEEAQREDGTKQAEETIRKAAAAAPQWYEPQLALADSYIAKDNLTSALVALDRVVEAAELESQDRPDSVEPSRLGVALVRRADLLARFQTNQLALDDNLLAIKLLPNDASIWLKAGLMLQRLDRIDEAKEKYAKAVSIQPDLKEQAANLASRSPEDQPDQAGITATRWIATSNSRRFSGDLTGAVTDIQKLIEFSPKSPSGYQLLAELQVLQGELEGAEKSLRTVLELVPNEPKALSQLGEVLLKKNDFSGAEDVLTRAIAADPGNAWNFARRMTCRIHLEDLAGAKIDFQSGQEALKQRDSLGNSTIKLWLNTWNNRLTEAEYIELGGKLINRVQAGDASPRELLKNFPTATWIARESKTPRDIPDGIADHELMYLLPITLWQGARVYIDWYPSKARAWAERAAWLGSKDAAAWLGLEAWKEKDFVRAKTFFNWPRKSPKR